MLTPVELYHMFALVAYFAAVFAAATLGMVFGVLDPATRRLRVQQLRHPAAHAALATLALGLALGAVSLNVADHPNRTLHLSFIAGTVLMALFAVPCFFVALPKDAPVPTSATPRQTAIWIAATLGVSFAGFYGLVFLLQRFGIEVKALENGMQDFMRPDLVVFFLGFCMLALVAAVLEEVIFRGAIQGLLMRTPIPAWAPIVITSLIWTLGHAGAYVEPVGVKELHIFALGLVFGIARQRHGLRLALLLHVTNNGAALLLATLAPEWMEF